MRISNIIHRLCLPFPDTHPAIIDRETFALVQNLRQHRRRPTRTGIVSMFSGLLYCADCGSKLGYSATNNCKREQAFFFCSAYRGNSDVCSAHFIREKVVEELVLEGLQRLLWYIQVYEKRFAQEQMERFGLQEKKELTPEIVHEFIDKIVVAKPDKVGGKRHQRVDIHYNTIGLWCAPSPEEMEKLFQKHLSGQRKKTA